MLQFKITLDNVCLAELLLAIGHFWCCYCSIGLNSIHFLVKANVNLQVIKFLCSKISLKCVCYFP